MKCTKCNGEWTPPPGKSITACPFCGASLQAEPVNADSSNVIAEIVRRFGDDTLLDPQKLSGLISDLIPSEPATKKRLNLAINEKVPQKLHGLKNKDEHERDRIMRIEASGLSDVYDMAVETAYDIVNYFAEALGYKTIMVAPRQAQPTPTVPPKPSFPFESDQVGFTDPRDGKFYKTIKIDGQVWMAENLNYAAEGSKCYNNEEANGAKYGRLYDWETAKKACPTGWHLPSNEEWDKLVDFVGGEKIAGKKLKSTSGWNYYKGKSGNGANEYGFSALPGGFGYSDGSFYCAGNLGIWWSATEYYAWNAWRRVMDYDSENVYRHDDGKATLYSVRCVQDLSGTGSMFYPVQTNPNGRSNDLGSRLAVSPFESIDFGAQDLNEFTV
jgi:uncharacterized protein (TIGR02145 family)